jgi:hypothetical protein
MKKMNKEEKLIWNNRVSALRQRVIASLGKDIGDKVDAAEDGTLYVEAVGRAICAWLIDFVLIVGLSVVLGLVYYKTHLYEAESAAGASVIIIFLCIALPFTYGWFYSNGRGVGALVTGTRLVRRSNGQNIGLLKAGWAMFARIYGRILFVIGLLGGSTMDVTQRVSIDIEATKRLYGAGFTSLNEKE